MDEPCLITGASGFIGARLLAILQEGREVRTFGRRQPQGRARHFVGDLEQSDNMGAACAGVATVFHCAGHAHAFGGDPGQLHRRINYEGTCRLADAAAAAGVRQFVFLSSVKAVAEPGDACVDETWDARPASPYGQAKRAAEDYLQDLGQRTGMRVVSLRPAMVYGAGGRGNLERMARLIARGRFPALPETGNRRSLVHVRDLVDVMGLAERQASWQGAYIVAHPHAPSGRELYTAIRACLGLPLRDRAVPASLLRALAGAGDLLQALLGRDLPFNREVLDKLLGSSCYLPGRLAAAGWQARVDLAEGLAEMLGGPPG